MDSDNIPIVCKRIHDILTEEDLDVFDGIGVLESVKLTLFHESKR